MFTALSSRTLRAGFQLAILSSLLVSACAKQRAARRARAEQHQAIAKVFESAQPYATRTVSDADLNAFLAKNVDYNADSAEITDFYHERKSQFAWILDDSITASAEAFVALAGVIDVEAPGATKSTKRLSALYARGFTEGQKDRVALCDSCATDLELRLTAEYYRFVNGPHGGNLDRDLNTLIPAAKQDYRRLLDSLSADKMDLAGYAPVNPQYALLREQVKGYAKLASAPWPALELPAGAKSIKPGDSSAVVADIGARLNALGDLSIAQGARYDSAAVLGVKRFQSRHGMHPDGIIDADFMRELNVSPAERTRTMLVNMERMRWTSEAQPPNLLRVNIPEFRLHVLEQGKDVMDMDVVVGNVATRTVAFSDTMTQVVFSPSWSLPASIVRKDVVPGMAKDPGYLAKHHMKITGGSGSDLGVVEEPGPTNPLGGVKFLFPNSFSIYMHDSPARSAFDKEVRAVSHGCVRLSRAGDLAEFLLSNDSEWPKDKIHAAMTSGRETFVKLKQSWPVSIEYFTAWVDRDGVLQFRDDIYGHDTALSGELFASTSK
jgi:murein L,D-transpeptidase YcbB/YkuD